MNVGNLGFRDAFVQQFLFQIVVHIELPIIVRGGEVNENHLRGLFLRCPLPDVIHIFGADGDFPGIAVRKHGVNEPLIQCQLPAIVGDDQHIVLIGIYLLIAHLFRPLGKTGDDFLLLLRGL